MPIPTKNIIRIILATVGILLIPFVAMQLNNDVDWSLFDFLIVAVFLIAAGLIYEVASSRAQNTAYRVGIALAIVTALILMWMNAAVGIIGNEENSLNQLFLVVILIGIVGAAAASFKPQGMVRSFYVTALAQALVPIVALLLKSETSWGSPGVIGVFVLNSFFVAMWIVTALLFRRASVVGLTRSN